MEFEFDTAYKSAVKIKVVGVGGGGNNAVNRMIQANIKGVEFIAINTDRQALESSCAAKKLVIGNKTTGGKGAGANPTAGRQSAEESLSEIKEILSDTDMLFITAGMGGGTGTGAAPIVAKTARELGILTVGIVTKPFAFEGKRRMEQADAGINELAQYVDSLIVIPNERLKQIEDSNLQFGAAFEIADDVLRRGVQSVSDVINFPGLVNLDFADVTTIMKNAGYAHMGVGQAKGEEKAKLAATMAISSPLLSTSIAGAMGVLVSITASPDIQLNEIDEASSMIHEEAHPDANIIWGTTFNEDLQNEMRITIIATGFNNANEALEAKVSSSTASIDDELLSKKAYEEPKKTPSLVQEFDFDSAQDDKKPEFDFSQPTAEADDEVKFITKAPTAPPVTFAEDEDEFVNDTEAVVTPKTSVKDVFEEYETSVFKCIKRIKKK